MARSTRTLLGFVVALALVIPSLAGAQAVPRGGGSSGGSSSGGSSSGGSSSGGESSGGSSTSPSRDPSPPPPAHTPSRTPTGKTGSTTPRGSDGGGSAASTRGDTWGRNSSTTDASASVIGSAATATLRDHNGRPIRGTAVARDYSDPAQLSFRLIGRPLYTVPYGWNLGFYTYDPWRYSSTRWVWGRYGLWYDPFWYNSYWYDPFYDSFYNPWYSSPYGYSSSYGYGGSGRHEDVKPETGSIRLRINPSHAQVYLDGSLAGIVDDFDGLSKHLVAEAGAHQLEIRANGYTNYTTSIMVESGKTITERASLKKQ